MIAGHAHPRVVEAVRNAAERGLSFGTPTPGEVTMAEKICEVTGLERVRLVNSGTEATMSALRLARAATGRDRVIKFEGCYHGHADSFLVKAGSGALTLGVPSSPGVPKGLADLTHTLPYNDLGAVRKTLEEIGNEVATIIVEPIAGNMNFILPEPGFLEGLRELCDRHGVVLIFDEVMTGFRVALGGAQERFGVRADLVTYGKVIGGGMPVGAFGGRAELMAQVSPEGPVYQAGTLSGNPLAVAAGEANLDLIREPGFFDRLQEKNRRLMSGLQAAAADAGVPFTTVSAGGMFGMFFTEAERVASFEDSAACNKEHFAAFFNAMLERGVYLAPSSFEAGFISQAHEDREIERTLEAAGEAFATVARAV